MFQMSKQQRWSDSGYYCPILSCFWKIISVSDPNPLLVETVLSVFDNYSKVYCDAQHTFLCCVYFASWGKITAGVILPLTEHDWSSHKKSLEHMSCLVDHDISNSSPNQMPLRIVLVTWPLQPTVFNWRQNSPSIAFASWSRIDTTWVRCALWPCHASTESLTYHAT